MYMKAQGFLLLNIQWLTFITERVQSCGITSQKKYKCFKQRDFVFKRAHFFSYKKDNCNKWTDVSITEGNFAG